MKRLFPIAIAMLGATLIAPNCAYAQDTPAAAEVESTESAETTEPVSVPDMLKEVKFLTKAKPKKKVSVYFFLRSHSKCGFCRKITPEMNELYKAMKGKGAELIMLSGDSDLKLAKEWATEAEMSYPIVTQKTAGAITVPAGGSGGTPNIVAVTPDGTVLENGSGASACTRIAGSWKELVKEAKKANKAAAKKAKKAKKKAKAAEAEELPLD